MKWLFVLLFVTIINHNGKSITYDDNYWRIGFCDLTKVEVSNYAVLKKLGYDNEDLYSSYPHTMYYNVKEIIFKDTK